MAKLLTTEGEAPIKRIIKVKIIQILDFLV